MDDRDRAHIQKNIDRLVQFTEFEKLIKACEEAMIISPGMRSIIENLGDASVEQKHKELFLKITRRGPTAYDDLIKILVNLDYSKAAALLKNIRLEKTPYVSLHANSTVNRPLQENYQRSAVPEGCYPSKMPVSSDVTLVPYTEEIKESNFVVKKSTHLHNDPKMSVYPMKTRNRGVYFGVNIIDFPKSSNKRRSGAEVDGKSLLYLFQQLGFTCFPYENLTYDQFFDILKKLLRSEYCARTECFVLILMSHGEMDDDMHDRVEFYDGSIVKVNDIEDKLSNLECVNLRNKPKVLIFPFCRGKTVDKGVHELQSDGFVFHTKEPKPVMATRSDMLVCYASVRGFRTLRDPSYGSWYIQTFVEILAEHAHDTHLDDMLKLIGDKVRTYRSEEGGIQMPAYSNHGFTKSLFFNPGVYEDEQ